MLLDGFYNIALSTNCRLWSVFKQTAAANSSSAVPPLHFVFTKMQDPKRFLAEHKLSFTDLDLLEEALNHPSYVYEIQKAALHKAKPRKDNQRLEYLGDSVLDLIINDYLFWHFPQYAEGKLTRLRSSLTCQETLAQVASELELGKFLRLGKGEAKLGGEERSSNLADCLEAVIGAFYLDQGFAKTKEYVCSWFQDKLQALHSLDDPGEKVMDAKSYLQECTQRDIHKVPAYEEVSHRGPAHRKKFTVRVLIEGEEYAQGSDFSLKGAEQKAAAKALEKYNQKYGQKYKQKDTSKKACEVLPK